MPMFKCPLSGTCDREFKSEYGLRMHWVQLHRSIHGSIENHRCREAAAQVAASLSASLGGSKDCEVADSSEAGQTAHDDLLNVAMAHIDAMKFKYYEKDADIERAKRFVEGVLAAIRPPLQAALQPHVREGVDVSTLIAPVLSVFDDINSRCREATTRRAATKDVFSPLQVYPRKLGDIGECAAGKRRKRRMGSEAYAYDTKLEEVLEREMRVDPSLITEMILAHEHWLRRSKEIKSADLRSPNRTFSDICDGQAWQEHPFLGDPDYAGPVRLAFEGYCDDVDIPNPIGTASGHNKLWLSFLVLLNRPPRSRMTLRSIHLATVCLSHDFKLFGPEVVISDPDGGYDSTSIGATMRRFADGVTLSTPPTSGIDGLPVRGWMAVWTADGMAQGEVYGTNSSFSKAINICNLCEDMDQRCPDKRKPCGFLTCACQHLEEHAPHCKCHFRLRTAARDAARPSPLPRDLQQRLGITTLHHGFTGVTCFNVARPGPKEPMHAFAEGRTKHLAAYTIWNVVASGLATKDEVRAAAHRFDWSPGGGSSGFFNPTYLPDKLFSSTKVQQDDGSWAWGPQKEECKLPFSAAGVITFTVMSLAFFQQFFPTGADWPNWFRAWVLHAHAVLIMLRYKFTYNELVQLEELVVESETLIAKLPEYKHVWIPKAHWILHLAKDIYDWGPARLLWVMLKEMKNASFKRGCKRSNFHNPVKSTALFWAQQSDYEALQLLKHPDLRSATDSSMSRVLVSGRADSFKDSQVSLLLLQHGRVAPSDVIEFLQAIRFQGVLITLGDHCFYDGCKLFKLERIARCASFHYLWLRLLNVDVSVDSLGMFHVTDNVLETSSQTSNTCRLVSLTNTSDITCLWTVHQPQTSSCKLIVKH